MREYELIKQELTEIERQNKGINSKIQVSICGRVVKSSKYFFELEKKCYKEAYEKAKIR